MCENSINGIVLYNMSRKYQVQSMVVNNEYYHKFYFVTKKLLEIFDNNILFR